MSTLLPLFVRGVNLQGFLQHDTINLMVGASQNKRFEDMSHNSVIWLQIPGIESSNFFKWDGKVTKIMTPNYP